MDIKELRVGNYIRLKNGKLPYWNIIPEDLIEMEYQMKNYFPVELTQDILVKISFGYERIVEPYFIKHIFSLRTQQKAQLKIEQWKETMKYDDSYALYIGDSYICQIKYLHKLQNVVYDILGEEFELY